MFAGNRGIIFTILIVFVLSIAALVGVFYSLVNALNIWQFGQVHALEPDRNIKIVSTENNYNFSIPDKQEPQNTQSEQQNTDDTDASTSQTSEQDNNQANKQVEKRQYNYSFAVPAKTAEKVLPAMENIQIPSIQYNSPIVITNDADTGVDNGAWYHPSSYHPMDGEAIFLCHRRYFKSNDPKSCWNLDKVNIGTDLYINYADGTQTHYTVESIAVTNGEDLNVFYANTDKVIKLISCAKEDGKIGSDSHRIIVIARES